MRRLVVASLFASLALFVLTPAARAAWCVGTDAGLAVWSPDEGESLTSFGWGGAPGFPFVTFQPAFRVSGTLGSPRHELVTTSSLSYLSSNGNSFSSFQFMAGYQYNFAAEQTITPLVNLGVGFLHIGGDSDSATQPVFGVGIGVRRMFSHRHGALRWELRLDHQFESTENGFIQLPSANTFGIKMGFEMWN